MQNVNLIPFSTSTNKTEAALMDYLCKQKYLPVEFLDPENKIENITVYAPIYIFSVSYEAEWQASFGFHRQEHYTEHQEVYNSRGKERIPVNRTKIVTDWRPANGRARGSMTLTAYAGEGLPIEAIELIEGIGLENILSTDVRTLDVKVEPFSKSEEQVWASRANERLEAQIDRDVKGRKQGDIQRDWSWDATSSYSASNLLCPTQGVRIKFDNKEYDFWIDGSNINRIKHTELPRDEKMRRDIFFGFLPFALIFAAAVLYRDYIGSSSAATATIIVLLGVAIIGGLVRKSKVEAEARDALLSRASSGLKVVER